MYIKLTGCVNDQKMLNGADCRAESVNVPTPEGVVGRAEELVVKGRFPGRWRGGRGNYYTAGQRQGAGQDTPAQAE